MEKHSAVHSPTEIQQHTEIHSALSLPGLSLPGHHFEEPLMPSQIVPAWSMSCQRIDTDLGFRSTMCGMPALLSASPKRSCFQKPMLSMITSRSSSVLRFIGSIIESRPTSPLFAEGQGRGGGHLFTLTSTKRVNSASWALSQSAHQPLEQSPATSVGTWKLSNVSMRQSPPLLWNSTVPPHSQPPRTSTVSKQPIRASLL